MGLLLCGLYALQALFGKDAVKKRDLDKAALTVSKREAQLTGGWLLPNLLSHKWPVLGNYSIEVLQEIVDSKGFELTYLNTNKVSPGTVGLLCNVKSSIRGRHWMALKPIEDTSQGGNQEWLNLDSRLAFPVNVPQLDVFLRNTRESGGFVLALVQRKSSTADGVPIE
mmetsp:Transcript_17724/g.32665  ORF Transcript_17724/g.32665 Transcript_17724/m.32665 type:complete len:168 (-) Transcript_17724:187-690(-)